MISALGQRSYHLPGNSWCADWCQFFANNHPLFGICCHHALNPVKVRMRIVNLVGSIVFGLLVTNIIWLWFIYNEDDATFVTISVDGIDLTNSNSTITSTQEIQITEGMLLLWTVGGGLHAIFDNTIWYATACVCCLAGERLHCLGRYKWAGSYCVIIAVVACTAMATFCVVLRASLDSESTVRLSDINSGGITDDNVHLSSVKDLSAFDFLVSYAVELVLALFVYYPLIGTVLFSGILGCGKMPILGGRPYEVLKEERLAKPPPTEDSWGSTEHTSQSHARNPV
jgi:hypothetical protein